MPLLTAVVAAVAVLIAYFQWRTAHQRVILDLFDRRLEVVKNIEDACRKAVSAAPTEVHAGFWLLGSARHEARFLFGRDVVDELDELNKSVTYLYAFSNTAADNPEKQEKAKGAIAATEQVAGFVSGSAESLFAPYLRLDQKMPGLWWPLASLRATLLPK